MIGTNIEENKIQEPKPQVFDVQEGVEVNPYGVTNTSGKEIDYDKLIKYFGCQKINEDLIKRCIYFT